MNKLIYFWKFSFFVVKKQRNCTIEPLKEPLSVRNFTMLLFRYVCRWLAAVCSKSFGPCFILTVRLDLASSVPWGCSGYSRSLGRKTYVPLFISLCLRMYNFRGRSRM